MVAILSLFFLLSVAPMINSTTPDQSYSVNSTTTLYCTALGGPRNDYKWRVNGGDVNSTQIDGSRSELTLEFLDSANGGIYSCLVSNAAGNDTEDIAVFISPYFITEPESTGGMDGGSANLTCEADAFPAPQYQWGRVNGQEVSAVAIGINSPMLMFDPLQFGNEGEYYCNVTSGESSIRSDVATLACKVPPSLPP